MRFEVTNMFNRKNSQKIAAVIIIVVVAAMLATAVLPALM